MARAQGPSLTLSAHHAPGFARTGLWLFDLSPCPQHLSGLILQMGAWGPGGAQHVVPGWAVRPSCLQPIAPVPLGPPSKLAHHVGSAVPQVVSIFSLVEVVLQAEATALKYSAILKRPGTEGLLGPQYEECDNDSEQED